MDSCLISKSQLSDLPLNALKELRYLFEHNKVEYIETLISEVKKRSDLALTQIEDTLRRSLGSTTLTWEHFLQLLEEEINDHEKAKKLITFGLKKIFLSKGSRVDFSANPTKYTHPQYKVTYMEFLRHESSDLCLLVLNQNTLLLTDRLHKIIYSKIDFRRDFEKHFQAKLFREQQERDRIEKEMRLRNIGVSYVSSSSESSHLDSKNRSKSYDFNILKYAGIENPKRKKSRRLNSKVLNFRNQPSIEEDIPLDLSTILTEGTTDNPNNSDTKSNKSFNSSYLNNYGSSVRQAKNNLRSRASISSTTNNMDSSPRASKNIMQLTPSISSSRRNIARDNTQRISMFLGKDRVKFDENISNSGIKFYSTIRKPNGGKREDDSIFSEIAKMENLVADVRMKLRRNDSKRDSHHYSKAEGKMIKKMFNKFKLCPPLAPPQKMRPQSPLSKTVDSRMNVMDLTMGDFQQIIDDEVEKKREEQFNSLVSGFKNREKKFRRNLGWIGQIIAGDTQNIKIKQIETPTTHKRLFGYKMYNYERLTESVFDNVKGVGTKLSVSSCYYAPIFDLFIVGFLSRDVFSYKIEIGRDERYELIKIEEYRNKDFLSHIAMFYGVVASIMFMLVVERMSSIKVFEMTQSEIPNRILSDNLQNQNVRFSIDVENDIRIFEFNPLGGAVYSDCKSRVFVLEQVEIENFDITKNVEIPQQFDSTTVNALAFGKSSSIVAIGTVAGDFLLYDIQLEKTVFQYKEIRCKIIDIRIVEALKNVYVFWENHKFKVLDSLTLQFVQEGGESGMPEKANFVYFPNIDINMDYRMIYERTKRKLGTSEGANEIALNLLNSGRLNKIVASPFSCIYFGASLFTRYNLSMRSELQVDEAISIFKNRNPQSILKELEERWVHCIFCPMKKGILLVNDKLYMIFIKQNEYFHGMLEIDDEIARGWISPDGEKLFFCSTSGIINQYALPNLIKEREIQVPLDGIEYSDTLEEGYSFCFINRPNEIYSLKRSELLYKTIIIKELTNGKNVDSMKLREPILATYSVSSYIVIITEDFELLMFKKRNMKIVKTLSLKEGIDINLFQMKDIESGNTHQKILIDKFVSDSMIGLRFEGGAILIIQFSKRTTTNISIFTHILVGEMVCCLDNSETLYTFDSNNNFRSYKFTPEEYISFKEINKLLNNKSIQVQIRKVRRNSVRSIDNIEMASYILGRSGRCYTQQLESRVDQYSIKKPIKMYWNEDQQIFIQDSDFGIYILNLEGIFQKKLNSRTICKEIDRIQIREQKTKKNRKMIRRRK